jgi:restriction system protein
LRQAGWEANVTQGSGDQGVDILAEKAGHSLAIHCKKYGIPVGNKAVQEAHAGSEFVGADAAAIITNSSFTPAAKALAGTLNVQLLHHEQLAKL